MDVALASSRPPGGPRAVLEASVTAAGQDDAATLAVVVATEGSTYVRGGAVALFARDAGQVGWLSGGCLEPEIEQRALRCAQRPQLDFLDIDTRDDEALLSGSALGCRGRLRIALLPLRALPGWADLVMQWSAGAAPLRLDIGQDGRVTAEVGHLHRSWQLSSHTTDAVPDSRSWHVQIAPPPAVLVFGAGPEATLLLPMLRSLGWLTTLVERRSRWIFAAALADHHLALTPEGGLAGSPANRFDAALVMHHNFELDREALAALADSAIAFIGLLGPVRRREDLFRLLAPAARDALLPRLHSPVGLDLGGHGPEAVALSIAAQLHAYRHSP